MEIKTEHQTEHKREYKTAHKIVNKTDNNTQYNTHVLSFRLPCSVVDMVYECSFWFEVNGRSCSSFVDVVD